MKTETFGIKSTQKKSNFRVKRLNRAEFAITKEHLKTKTQHYTKKLYVFCPIEILTLIIEKMRLCSLNLSLFIPDIFNPVLEFPPFRSFLLFLSLGRRPPEAQPTDKGAPPAMAPAAKTRAPVSAPLESRRRFLKYVADPHRRQYLAAGPLVMAPSPSGVGLVELQPGTSSPGPIKSWEWGKGGRRAPPEREVHGEGGGALPQSRRTLLLIDRPAAHRPVAFSDVGPPMTIRTCLWSTKRQTAMPHKQRCKLEGKKVETAVFADGNGSVRIHGLRRGRTFRCG